MPIERSGNRPVITPRPADTTTATTGAGAPADVTAPDAPPGPSGLDAATDAGTVPHDAGAPASGAPTLGAGVGPIASRFAQTLGGPNLFSLRPGLLQDAVGLDVVLAQIPKTPAGQAGVKQLIAGFEQKTGVKVPDAMVAAAMANPQHLANILQLTPGQMSAGIDALNAAHQAGKVPDTKPRTHRLPQTFDFADLAKVKYDRPDTAVKELAPGLLRGDVKNDALSDDQAKMNVALAEVFDRLSANATAEDGDKFTIQYGGGNYTRVDTFLGALAKDGYEIEAKVDHRVANFAGLFTKAPTGQLLDVPAPLMVRTGVKDAAGQEAVVPAVHSELVISIKSGPESKQKLDGDIKFYQGVSATGFFPCDINRTPTWAGATTADVLTGQDALKAVELAGLLTDIINDASASLDLVAAGYGVTGVCNDSVAVIQQALTGHTTAYPLLMRDDTLLGEFQARLGDKDHRDDPEYRTLKSAIDALPSDMTANASAQARAEASMPWKPGQEPFVSSAHARAALTGS